MSLHPLAIAGIALIAVGALAYLVSIVVAVLRVRRQYSGYFLDEQHLRVGAALTAAATNWYWLLVVGVGAALLYAGR